MAPQASDTERSPPRLSKSRVAAFEHCARRLWLQVHAPQLARFDEATIALFKCGHQIGELARWRSGEGVLVSEDHHDIVGALARTTELMMGRTPPRIFEAAFERDRVVVRVDILEPDDWGGFRIIEVKNTARVKQYQVADLATQHWVLSGSGVCVSSAIIRHVARPLRPERLDPAPVRFIDADLTAPVFAVSGNRAQVIARARLVIAGAEPAVSPGRHCERPSCEFRDHCLGANAQPTEATE